MALVPVAFGDPNAMIGRSMRTEGSIDKAVILARGLGTRMRKPDATATLDSRQAAIAESGVKAMIPVGAGVRGGTDRPFLDYVLAELAEAGFRRACLVIGPEHEQVREYYGQRLKPRRLTISFAIQDKPLGTANAIAAAEAFAAGEGFLMINSDNLYPAAACAALRELGGAGVALFERDAMLAGSNIAPDRVMKFAAAVIDERGNLQRVIEKPDAATLASLGPEVYLSMNCWRFSGRIFEACRAIKPSPRGEYEITDAAQYAIDELGETFRVVRSREPVLDLSSRGDIGLVAAKLAAKLAGKAVEL
jgi:dTDP-glucose pyrophosphorylase